MALTDSLVTFSQWVKTHLEDAAFLASSGIQMVTYGDQEKIAATPTVCVEPSEKGREYNGAPRRTLVRFEIFILIYHGSLQSVQQNRKEADQLAEAVEARLHDDPTCGSLVVSSLVSNLSSGVANKGGTLLRATRLTFTAQSQTMLPMAGV
jgi:hypothetical protein